MSSVSADRFSIWRVLEGLTGVAIVGLLSALAWGAIGVRQDVAVFREQLLMLSANVEAIKSTVDSGVLPRTEERLNNINARLDRLATRIDRIEEKSRAAQ